MKSSKSTSLRYFGVSPKAVRLWAFADRGETSLVEWWEEMANV
jgi:hypothetical protein